MDNHEEKERISVGLMEEISRVQPQKAHVTRDDVPGTLASFLPIFTSGFIAVIPFFFLPNNVYLALKISSVASIVPLFNVGYQWAEYTDRNRTRTGAGMVLIGFAISAVTTLLGE